MPLVIPAIGGMLVVAGLIGIVLGFTPRAVREPVRARARRTPLSDRWHRVSRRTKILALLGLAAGIAVWVITGWAIAVVVAPVAVPGIPVLLSAPGSVDRIDRLEALEEWTRGMAGVLTVGVSLEEAIRATLRSAPDPIRTEVTALVARLRARVSTEEALRAFANDIDDATGDMVAGYLILGARRRGQGLATVLNSLAESVAADVRARRAIEADRAKPRTTARWITIVMLSVLGYLFVFADQYVAPYRTPFGQLLLAFLLGLFVLLLVWLRSLAKGERLPRFLNEGTGR